MMIKFISSIISIIMVEFFKEERKYRSDRKLGEELLFFILTIDNPKYMSKNHTNVCCLCKEKLGTLNHVIKRLRKRGFNREADMVEKFVEQIKIDTKAAVNYKNSLASVRLCLISYKGLGPIFDVRIKLDGLKHDYDFIHRLSVR